MNKDPGKISSLLNFLTKMLDKFEERGREEERNKIIKIIDKSVLRKEEREEKTDKILRILDKNETAEEINRIKETFRRMLGFGTESASDKKIFYLIECPELDGKSLLSYINSQNVRLFRQREELIDLSVKMRDEFPREACRDCLWS